MPIRSIITLDYQNLYTVSKGKSSSILIFKSGSLSQSIVICNMFPFYKGIETNPTDYYIVSLHIGHLLPSFIENPRLITQSIQNKWLQNLNNLCT